MLSQEDRDALRAMREEMEAEDKQRQREFGKNKGRILDQIELCYKQHSPPQIESLKSGSLS